jgi:mono/diheme cytochrome c family protein
MSSSDKKSSTPHIPAPEHQRAEQAAVNDASIQKVHAILLREKAEPHEGFSPMPLFLLGFISAMILVCAIYVVHYRGDFDPLVYDERYDAEAAKAAASAPKELTPEQVLAKGKQAFQTCVACHQTTGLGLPGVYPPLAGSEWVTGNEERLIRVLLHGLNGPVQVKGSAYNNSMPAFGKVAGGAYNWNDEKISHILTYIRHEWGNNAAPVTKAKVAEVFAAEKARTKAWTQDELKAFE